MLSIPESPTEHYLQTVTASDDDVVKITPKEVHQNAEINRKRNFSKRLYFFFFLHFYFQIQIPFGTEAVPTTGGPYVAQNVPTTDYRVRK